MANRLMVVASAINGEGGGLSVGLHQPTIFINTLQKIYSDGLVNQYLRLAAIAEALNLSWLGIAEIAKLAEGKI